MKEIETKKGVLKYDMPSVNQCFDILSIATSRTDGNKVDLLAVKKKIMEELAELIDHKSVGYKSFSDLGKDAENMALPLSDIAGEYYEYVMNVFTRDKKK